MERCDLCLRNHSKQREKKKILWPLSFSCPAPKANASHCPIVIGNQMGKEIWDIYPAGTSPVYKTEQVKEDGRGNRLKGHEASRQANR